MKKPATRSRPVRRAPRQLQPGAAPFIVSAAACLMALVATYLFFVKSATGQFIDESAWVEAALARRTIGTQTAQWLDVLPVTSIVIAAVVILFVTVARRRWKAAGIALVAMGAANLSTQLIKAGLPVRPNLGVETLAFNSLPSGHSTLAASAAVAVFLVVSPRWRPAAGFLGGTYAIVSGISTVINQWHRPADVMAAFFVVAFWAALAALVILRTGPTWNVFSASSMHWASRWWWTGLSAALAVAAACTAVLILSSEIHHSQTSTFNFFLAGMGQIVACGYLLTAAGILLLGWQVRRRAQPRRARSR
jgi:archaellum biogenesis protein FlaJ (TadC family)